MDKLFTAYETYQLVKRTDKNAFNALQTKFNKEGYKVLEWDSLAAQIDRVKHSLSDRHCFIEL